VSIRNKLIPIIELPVRRISTRNPWNIYILREKLESHKFLMSALRGKAGIAVKSAIGQKQTLAERLKTPQIGRLTSLVLNLNIITIFEVVEIELKY